MYQAYFPYNLIYYPQRLRAKLQKCRMVNRGRESKSISPIFYLVGHKRALVKEKMPIGQSKMAFL